MLIAFLKAFLLGLVVAMPPGPVALLVMQKTLTRGRGAGLVTSIGSVVVDTIYACVALVAISMVMHLINIYECAILLVGGAVVAAVGWNMFTKKPVEDFEGNAPNKTSAGYAIQCAGCALANPGAIALMLALVAFIGLTADELTVPFWALLPFVAAGEFTYWYFYTLVVKKLKNALTAHSLMWVNRIAGAVVITIGIVLVVRGVIMI